MNQLPSPPSPSDGTQLPENETGTSPQQNASPVQVSIQLPHVRPFVTYTLLGVTIFIYILQIATQFLLGYDLPVYYGLKVNALIAQGQVWRLFTPMFLHGSILHIAFNMYALWKIGPHLERYYGHGRYLGLYLISGFGGNVFSMMFTEASSLGSSTAIFGLLGAQGVFFHHNRDVFGPAFRQALNNIISIAMVNLVIGLSPGIDNWGHVGGLIGGVVYAWLGGPLLKVGGGYPTLALEDRRTSSEILQAGGVTTLFFATLAAGALYLMR